MTKFKKKLTVLSTAAALTGLASSAVAGGFAIGTQSGSGTGNAFAGGAAAADDASVAWYNPAAMTLLPGKQVAGALHILKPSFKFQNQGSTGAFVAPGTGDGGDGGDWAFVPNGFMTMAINPNLSVGFALNVPFGLKTEYDAGWRGQLTALKSEIKSVNLNPSVAYKINNMVSIGGGLSVQKIEAELTSNAALVGAGIVTLNADDIGFGFDVGVLVQASPSTRIGAHYRSKIKYDVEGTITMSTAPQGNGSIRADLEVPDTLSISAFHALNPNWELMGDITWTGWSSVQRLDVIRTTAATTVAIFPGAAGATVTSITFNWKDTWRYAVGANYKMSPQTKLRVGAALDKTPTNDVDRTPRLPDQDRTWLAFGLQYKPSKTSILDVGYAHEFIKDARVSTVTAAGTLNGTFKNKADIFSIQYSQSF